MKNCRQIILIVAANLMLLNVAHAYIGPADRSESSTRSSSAGCLAASTSTMIELNNVRALIHTGGDMWWDLQGNPSYEVPKGSGKHALFAGSIWIGGTDVNGQLRVAAQKFRQRGNDYWPGPLKASGPERASVTPDVCAKYDRHFVISRNQVSEFRTWWRATRDNDQDLLSTQFPNYEIPQIIKTWPAINFDPDYDYYLAPFWDENEDGFYNHEDGDYPFYDLDKILPCGTTRDLRRPRLYGDQTLWWVYNDKGNVHTETGGAAIGMEIRAQYFAFATNDELNNMTFGNYELINRSTFTLVNTYFGVWTDADLGDHSDDYVGCDVQRGLGYLYNGNEMDGDGNGKTYGLQPPAIGVDFFEGPYQDPNGSDWGFTGLPNGCDESINGLNFGDGIIDNERWGMRRFVYFNNAGGSQGDPNTAVEVYNYLNGRWKDGTRVTFGGTGYGGSVHTDFVFPGRPTTDICGWGTGGIPQGDWSEETENNPPADRRFVQSAGPFTLEPGAVNDITVGMVWARATSGGPWQSVIEVRRADDKAQRLFEVCFAIVDGPNAPELNIIELDKRLIFHIFNIKGSNNYNEIPEDYIELDPFIVCPDTDPSCDNFYKFEGYKVYQLKDESCNITDITNPNKARLVFQCDIKNDVSRLINYELDNELGVAKPVLKVDGNNKGIKHTFELIDDAFATGDRRLVNHKTYYFVAIAYAFNEFKPYYPDQGQYLDGQKMPYLASRSSATGAIKVFSAIPHIPSPGDGGTIINADYGEGPRIKQLEGLGGANNHLELTKETIDKIMSGPPWKADIVEYEKGRGPVNIKVIDPLNVPPYDFELKFLADSVQETTSAQTIQTIIKSRWLLTRMPATNKEDSIFSDHWIDFENEQLIPQWGISITIEQVGWPGKGNNPSQNGYIYSSITWGDPLRRWLDLETAKDNDGSPLGPDNWIRSGRVKDNENPGAMDYPSLDDKEYYEKVVGGTWAPYLLVCKDFRSSDPNKEYRHGIAYHNGQANIKWEVERLSSIDFVITKDKKMWSRSPVMEMCNYDFNNGAMFTPGPSEGNQWKFGLRKGASIDKMGKTTNIGDTLNPNASNFIGATGMGWFPGYAIDVETGERLNIAYGEDSRYPDQNGRDMLWNPTNSYASDLYYMTGGASGDYYFGGKHYVYVFGHNRNTNDGVWYMPAYDHGKFIYDQLVNVDVDMGSAALAKRFVWRNVMWVHRPILTPDIIIEKNPSDPYYFIRTDVKVRIRVANPYRRAHWEFAKENPVNYNLPYYSFSLKDIATTKDDLPTAKDALDLIRVVPNPYYGYSEYERSQLQNLVKITNLPQVCTISIFTVNGTLIRRFKKDSPLSYQDWDLKNEYGISIASGIYIVHVDVPGVGEKIVKWFGALRPIDLTNF